MTEFDPEYSDAQEAPLEAPEVTTGDAPPRQPAASEGPRVEGSRWFAYIAVGLTVVALLVGLAAVAGVIYVLARLR